MDWKRYVVIDLYLRVLLGYLNCFLSNYIKITFNRLIFVILLDKVSRDI